MFGLTRKIEMVGADAALPGRSQPIRVGFTYNVKRTQQSDDQAEWDPPETIIARR